MKKNIVPLIALIGGTALIIVAIFLDNGNLLMFWSVTSLFITMFGSFAALLVSYPTKYLKTVPSLMKQIFIVPSDSRLQLVSLFTNLSRKARKEGLLSLEDDIAEYEDQFLKRGLQMVVDELNLKPLEILELEIETTENRHA